MKKGQVRTGRGMDETVWLLDVPGLAAWNFKPSEDNPITTVSSWTLLHVQSGRSMGHADTRAQVVDLADRLHDCGDWDVPLHEIPPAMFEEAAYIVGQWSLERSWEARDKKAKAKTKKEAAA